MGKTQKKTVLLQDLDLDADGHIKVESSCCCCLGGASGEDSRGCLVPFRQSASFRWYWVWLVVQGLSVTIESSFQYYWLQDCFPHGYWLLQWRVASNVNSAVALLGFITALLSIVISEPATGGTAAHVALAMRVASINPPCLPACCPVGLHIVKLLRSLLHCILYCSAYCLYDGMQRANASSLACFLCVLCALCSVLCALCSVLCALCSAWRLHCSVNHTAILVAREIRCGQNTQDSTPLGFVRSKNAEFEQTD
jgi:hypothetical protein